MSEEVIVFIPVEVPAEGGKCFMAQKELNLTKLAEKMKREIQRAEGEHGPRSYYWKEMQCAGISAFLLAIKTINEAKHE